MKTSKARILAVIIILHQIISFDTIGQIWPKVYDDYKGANVATIIESYDHGYAALGWMLVNVNYSYGWMFKTDINGEILWQKTYGNSQYHMYLSEIQVTSDNGFIISGATSKYNAMIWYDPLFVKLNTCGEIEWCTVLGEASGMHNYATGIIQLEDGSFIGMLKYYGDDVQNIRISLVKMDAQGNPVWIKHQAQEDPTVFNEEGYDLTLSFNDNYLISGLCRSAGTKPYWIMTDSNGDEIWNIKWGLTGTSNGGVLQTIKYPPIHYYSSGALYSQVGRITPSIFKFDEMGNQIYHCFLLGDTIVGGSAKRLCQYNDSTIIVGLNWSDSSDPDTGYSEILKIDTLGNLKNQRFLIDENRSPEQVVTTFDKKILAIGHYFVENDWDIYLWKLNSDLENDTLYTQQMNYDSLCPYAIPSDTVDISCGLYVSIGDIPTKEEYENPIKVWPNPVSDVLTLKLNHSSILNNNIKALHIIISDQYGRIREKDTLSSLHSEKKLNVSDWESGIYQIVISRNGIILQSEKLVVLAR